MHKNLKCSPPELLINYSEYIRVIKNRSERTVEQYQNDLVLFLCYVKARLDGEYTEKLNAGKFKGFAMDVRCFFGTFLSVLRSDGVVEGGTGELEKQKEISSESALEEATMTDEGAK